MLRRRLNLLLDLSWGSTGKGKLVGYLAPQVDVAICNFPTNAGHTVVKDDGTKFVLQQLPVAVINPSCRLLIGPGAIISMPKLLEELDVHKAAARTSIHPNALIITEEAVAWEKENLKHISSTLKGCGAALGLKTMRAPNVRLAKDEPALAGMIADTADLLHTYIRSGAMCLCEGAQGFDLSLNHGHRYPFVTSRDVTPAAMMSDCGIPPQLVGHVYGSIRTFPIRVGHQLDADGAKVGDSGPCYPDQVEITWEDLERRSHAAAGTLLERTTVTNKVRRVFTFSMQQFRRSLRMCHPTHVFINFVNHIDVHAAAARTWGELPESVRDFVRNVENACLEAEIPGVDLPLISHLGTGARMSDMVELT